MFKKEGAEPEKCSKLVLCLNSNSDCCVRDSGLQAGQLRLCVRKKTINLKANRLSVHTAQVSLARGQLTTRLESIRPCRECILIVAVGGTSKFELSSAVGTRRRRTNSNCGSFLQNNSIPDHLRLPIKAVVLWNRLGEF